MKTNICVYGSSSSKIDKRYLDDAYHLGALMALKGYGLVFGAGDTGVMGAVARGAHAEGGYVTGVIPAFMGEEIRYKECDELIVVETMRERKQIMEDKSDAFIAAPGGIGTFEELFEMITLKQLKRHKKAIVMLNTMGYYDPVTSLLQKSVAERFAIKQTLDLYAVADTPAEAIQCIQNYTFREMPSKWFTDIET